MLIDTCIIIEIARAQEKADECKALLNGVRHGQFTEDVYITRFALNAIEAMVGKVDKKFLQKLLILIYQKFIKIYSPEIQDDMMTLSVLNDLGLDFDDATQFMAAQNLGTYIVTLDKDFQKVPIQTKTPAEVLKTILI